MQIFRARAPYKPHMNAKPAVLPLVFCTRMTGMWKLSVLHAALAIIFPAGTCSLILCPPHCPGIHVRTDCAYFLLASAEGAPDWQNSSICQLCTRRWQSFFQPLHARTVSANRTNLLPAPSCFRYVKGYGGCAPMFTKPLTFAPRSPGPLPLSPRLLSIPPIFLQKFP